MSKTYAYSFQNETADIYTNDPYIYSYKAYIGPTRKISDREFL